MNIYDAITDGRRDGYWNRLYDMGRQVDELAERAEENGHDRTAEVLRDLSRDFSNRIEELPILQGGRES